MIFNRLKTLLCPRTDHVVGPRIEPAVLFYIQWISKGLSLMFDVGAHNGRFARSVMQVLPPYVKMVLFEADPRHIEALNTLKASHPCIVQLVSKAVHHTSGLKVPFLQLPGEASHVLLNNDSNRNVSATIEVSAIALDDFIRETGLRPELIKIDAEGSEFDILNGAAGYIREYRPMVIFEDSNLRASSHMHDLGYTLINTATARELDLAEGNPSKQTLNIFGYDPAQAARYGIPPLARRPLATGPLLDFCVFEDAGHHSCLSTPFTSPSGKCLVEFDFHQQLKGNMTIAYLVDGEIIGQYGGDVPNIFKSYTSCPVHVPPGSKMRFRITSDELLDLAVNKVNISAL